MRTMTQWIGQLKERPAATTEERLEKVEQELTSARRRRRWVRVMASLATVVALGGPLAGDALGQLSRTTKNLPWGERLLVEFSIFGLISLIGVAGALGAYLGKRKKMRDAASTRHDVTEGTEDDAERRR